MSIPSLPNFNPKSFIQVAFSQIPGPPGEISGLITSAGLGYVSGLCTGLRGTWYVRMQTTPAAAGLAWDHPIDNKVNTRLGASIYHRVGAFIVDFPDLPFSQVFSLVTDRKNHFVVSYYRDVNTMRVGQRKVGIHMLVDRSSREQLGEIDTHHVSGTVFLIETSGLDGAIVVTLDLAQHWSEFLLEGVVGGVNSRIGVPKIPVEDQADSLGSAVHRVRLLTPGILQPVL